MPPIILVATLVFSCLFAGAEAGAAQFTLNTPFTLFQSNLGSVFAKYTEQPAFKDLTWCLLESNSGFVFLHCKGLNYSLIFDSASFLSREKSGARNFELLKKISEEEATPSMIQDVSTLGNSLTVISRNTTR